jgi:ribosome biogenesis GTPase / thiamine phosphate phosphatase
MLGRVARVSGPSASVLVGGEEREALVPPRLDGGPLVAGDWVDLRAADDVLVVRSVQPRETRLERGTNRGPKAVVANADLLLVVASVVDPPLRTRLVDRYLVAGWAGGLDSGILLTKVDLPHEREEVEAVCARYRDAGYPVLAGNAKDPAFLEEVARLMGGRVAALAGPSGVGKSRLTRGLTGIDRAVGSVSSKSGTGRHTTTDPRLIPLPDGGAVVDTAGVRTFFLPPLDAEDLAAAFPEIAAAAPGCRFRGCRHDGEAGCAVPDRVSPERLDSYRRMLAQL